MSVFCAAICVIFVKGSELVMMRLGMNVQSIDPGTVRVQYLMAAGRPGFRKSPTQISDSGKSLGLQV